MPIPIPEAVIDSALAEIDSSLGGIGAQGFSEEDVLESIFLPATFPPVSGILMSEDGMVWVEREGVPGHDRRWQVMSGEGELLAEVMVPIGFQLQLVGTETVWGLVLDELDVPYLVKRPLHRR